MKKQKWERFILLSFSLKKWVKENEAQDRIEKVKIL